MTDTIIRGNQPADFAACRALWVELTERHRELYHDDTIGGDDPGQAFEAYLANPARRGSWVAEVVGRVVGLTGLIVKGEEGEIEPVVVSHPYRSRGIGTMLVQHVVAQARALGIHYLGVWPVARNREAIAFFVGLGFDALGQVQLHQDLTRSRRDQGDATISIHGHEIGY